MPWRIAKREIGIRLALGARPGDVLGWVVGRGTLVVVPGLLIGGLSALGLGRLFQSLLYGLSPYDPTTLAVATSALGLVAILATWLPAVRATRVYPITTLRME